ncbi:MAG: hypothetical protein KAT05_16640 [Spirochaetes bacterium]|nr:hypothetical protein [Spirochaetota bacterium]
MKKIIFFIIILIIFFYPSCLKNKNVKKPLKSLNLTGETIEITGKIVKGKDNLICIIANWQLKSRVSYYVQQGKYQKKLLKNIGKIARVSVKITDEKSPWSKSVFVEDIIEIIDND